MGGGGKGEEIELGVFDRVFEVRSYSTLSQHYSQSNGPCASHSPQDLTAWPCDRGGVASPKKIVIPHGVRAEIGPKKGKKNGQNLFLITPPLQHTSLPRFPSKNSKKSVIAGFEPTRENP